MSVSFPSDVLCVPESTVSASSPGSAAPRDPAAWAAALSPLLCEMAVLAAPTAGGRGRGC